MPSVRLVSAHRSFRISAAALLFVLALSVVHAHDPASMQLARLGKLIKEQGPSVSIYLKRSAVYRSNRWWAEALADLDRAASIAEPERQPVVAARRAEVLLELGRPKEALESLEQVAVKSCSPELFVLEGRALEALGQMEAALTAYRRAFTTTKARFYPAWIDHYSSLLIRMGQIAQALNVTDAALQRWGINSVLLQRAVELEVHLGRLQDALARIDRMQHRSQRKDTWLFRKAELLLSAGYEDDAQRLYLQAKDALRQLPEYMRKRPQVREMEAVLKQRLGANS